MATGSGSVQELQALARRNRLVRSSFEFIDEKCEACHPWESNDWKMFNENDFCSDGERKDNVKRNEN